MDSWKPFADDLTALVPFWTLLGFEITAVAKARATLQVLLRPEHRQGDVIHGGLVATLADSACAVAAIAAVHPEAYATTASLNVAFLRPATGTRLVCDATCLRAGKTMLFCEARVVNDAGALVATASSQLVRVPFPQAAGQEPRG